MRVALCVGCLYGVDSTTPFLRTVNEDKLSLVRQGWTNHELPWTKFGLPLPAKICIFHKEKSNKMQQCTKILIIPYLYEGQHVSGDKRPIIRSLKLYWQPLVLHSWGVVARIVSGRCQTHCA